jgi:hypothetical protein
MEGVDFEGKVEELNTKYHLLQEEEYEAVFSEIKPFIHASMIKSADDKLF